MTDHASTRPEVAWGNKALAYARSLAESFPGRGSATQAEAAAAEHVRRQLATLGVKNVRTQPFQGQRSIWLFLAQVFGLALVGHAAVWLLAQPLGEIPALILSSAGFAFAFWQLWRKLTFQGDLKVLSKRRSPQVNSTQGPSQNVIAVFPAAEAMQRRVVLLAHLDSHRAVWVFAHPFIARAYSLIAPLALYGVLAAPLLYALALVLDLPAFRWLGIPLALIHFLSWFTGVTADLGPYSPGANDNASSVGSLLALAERLQVEPLAHTEVWLVFTGCEESGGDGMLRFLDESGADLKNALFLDLELVGIGDRLAYLETEGLLRRQSISPAVRSLVQQATQHLAARAMQLTIDGDTPVPAVSPILAGNPGGNHPASRFQIQPLNGSLHGAYTEMNIAWEHGFQGVCLMVLSSTERGFPQWHRLTDTSTNFQPKAFELSHAFVWEVLQIWI